MVLAAALTCASVPIGPIVVAPVASAPYAPIIACPPYSFPVTIVPPATVSSFSSACALARLMRAMALAETSATVPAAEVRVTSPTRAVPACASTAACPPNRCPVTVALPFTASVLAVALMSV